MLLKMPTDEKNIYESVDQLKEIILENRRVIMYENRSRCQFAAKFMPSLLSEAQKENHVNMCQGLQERLETDPEFFSKVITGDEMWVYGYHQKTKQDLSQWRSSSSPCPQKVRQVC